MPAPDALQLGTVLGGRYRLVRVLGEGGMGLVYEAMHERLRQPVAVKVLLPKLLDNAEVVARFEREARAASQLKGPNVARVIDVDVSESGAPYMVMELLEGHDIARELRLRGSMPWEEAVGYVVQACSAMIEAHSMGIVHRDLKPSNLFLQPEGGERIVKVLDFGISKLTYDDESNVTMTYSTIGTPLYMSPEQVRSAKHVDARTDEWALAVILFELIAGRPPFTGGPTAVSAAIVADDTPSLRDFVSDVPLDLVAVIERALKKKPAERYPDVASFAEALAPFAPEDGGARRRLRTGQSGGFRRVSVPPPAHLVQIKVDVPTLGVTPAQLPHDLAETMAAPPDQRPSQPRIQIAEAITAAPISPPASLATDASWSRSDTARRAAATTDMGRSWRTLMLAGVIGVAGLAAIVAAIVVVKSTGEAQKPSTASTSIAPAAPASVAPTATALASATPSTSSTEPKPVAKPAEPAPSKPPVGVAKPSAKPTASTATTSVTPTPPPQKPPPNPGPDLPVHL